MPYEWTSEGRKFRKVKTYNYRSDRVVKIHLQQFAPRNHKDWVGICQHTGRPDQPIEVVPKTTPVTCLICLDQADTYEIVHENL